MFAAPGVNFQSVSIVIKASFEYTVTKVAPELVVDFFTGTGVDRGDFEK